MPGRNHTHATRSLLGLSIGAGLALFAHASARADFTTVLNSIGDNQTLGSDTLVNISNDAIGDNVNAGNPDGTSTNIEVYNSGGSVGTNFNANAGSMFMMWGGTTAPGFNARAGSRVNLFGGTFGFVSFFNSPSDDAFEAFDGSTVNLFGGLYGNQFRTHEGSAVTINGGDFRIDGQLVGGLDTIGNTVFVNVPLGSVLSGTFADGAPFVFANGLDSGNIAIGSGLDSIADGTVTLKAVHLPVKGPAVVTDIASTPSGGITPFGLRQGQTLTGSARGDNFNAGWGSTVNLNYNTAFNNIRNNFEAVGANVTLGSLYGFSSVGKGFDAFFGTVVNIVGGQVGDLFEAHRGSTVYISRSGIFDGSIGNNAAAYTGSSVNLAAGRIGTSFRDAGTVNVAGGAIGNSMDALNGAVVNFSGGSIGADFDADAGAAVNIFGTQFVLAGTDITSMLTENVPLAITDRNVTLSGKLADGSAFDFLLNATNLDNLDFFDPGATLTITLVSGIPGDFNSDGTVNAADYSVWRNALGTTVAIRGKGGDGNFDGKVTQADFFVWKAHYGQSTGGGSGTSFDVSVPEPASALLFLLATSGLVVGCRGRWPAPTRCRISPLQG